MYLIYQALLIPNGTDSTLPGIILYTAGQSSRINFYTRKVNVGFTQKDRLSLRKIFVFFEQTNYVTIKAIRSVSKLIQLYTYNSNINYSIPIKKTVLIEDLILYQKKDRTF